MSDVRKTRVFVSYSQDSAEHGNLVKGLAYTLKGEGFEVFADVLVDRPKGTWPEQMEEWLRRADAVVCVCTARYQHRVDNQAAGDEGRGATYEGRFIRQELHACKDHDRFFVALLGQSGIQAIPRVLGDLGAHAYKLDDGHQTLIKALRRPTVRRCLMDAIAEAVPDREQLDAWGQEHLAEYAPSSSPDFDAHCRHVTDLLRRESADRQLAALVDLARRKPLRTSDLERVAEAFNLGSLRAHLGPPRGGEGEPSSPGDTADELQTRIDAYLTKAASRYGSIQIRGFETRDERLLVPIRLDELHVPLNAFVDRTPIQKGQALNPNEVDELAEGGRWNDEVPLRDAFEHAGRQGRRGVVVLGEPGSGKTTHVQRVLLSIQQEGPQSMGLAEGTVPFLLPLRGVSAENMRLVDRVARELEDSKLADGGLVEAVLAAGRPVLYLLDGLDEVADLDERTRVAGQIEDTLGTQSQAHMLVTCRYAGYVKEVSLGGGFLQLHLRPLDAKQARDFVHNWYRIVMTSLAKDEARAREEAEVCADELVEALKAPDFRAARVFQLTRNPLLLTTLCLVHMARGDLPKRRADLYGEASNVLLERWRAAKGLEVSIPASAARRVLQPVARWMHQQAGRTQATTAELLPQVEEAMRGVQGIEPSAEQLLKAVRDESGLLVGWGTDRYGFMHLGFQEYLVARELRSRGLEDRRVLRELAERFGDGWWQEVILLMLSLEDDPSVFTPFMEELLKSPNFAAEPGLVDLCLEEAFEVSAAPFVKVVAQWQRMPWWRRWLGGAWTLRKPEAVARVKAALRVVKELDEGALPGLRAGLRSHPSEELRRWSALSLTAGVGESRVEETSGVELVRIPGGTFWMGTRDGEGEESERPRHEVTLADFELGRYPVTNEEYGRYLKAKRGAKEPEEWGNRQFNQARQPVVGVSWEEAMKYCEWAGLTLPTEAQWEYACRAGTKTRYWSGDEEADLDRVGWYRKNSGNQLHAVGEKEANAFGLHDVHGNVWEWCMDAYGGYDAKPRAGDGLRHQPEGVRLRVLRGGSWLYEAELARAAFRFRHGPRFRSGGFGFRVARVIT